MPPTTSSTTTAWYDIVVVCASSPLADCRSQALPGGSVCGGDIIIGKTIAIPSDETRALDTGGGRALVQTRRDTSIALRASESGFVDQVMV